MDFLIGADLIFSVGIPDCGCILKTRSNKGFVRSFLCLLVADLEVAPKEAKYLVGFVGVGVRCFSVLLYLSQNDSTAFYRRKDRF